MLPGWASAEGFTRHYLNNTAGCSNRSTNEVTRRVLESYTLGTLRALHD